jgi:hypothetical protein
MCRRCEVGGTANDRESPEGYEALHNVCSLCSLQMRHSSHIFMQPGAPRTAATIRQANEEQKTEAFRRQRTTKIAELQSKSGVKDTVLNLWIEKILLEARAIRDTNPDISAAEMERQLRLWLDRQPGDKENPLLSVPGVFTCCSLPLHRI